VRGFVIRSVLQRLRELGKLLSTPTVPASAVVPSPPAEPSSGGAVVPAPGTGPGLSPATGVDQRAPAGDPPWSPVPPPVSPPADPDRAPGPGWRFVGLAHGNIALFETSVGIVLLDRRAAHERIWFERLREQFRVGNVPGQRLLLPVPLELDAIASALMLDRMKFLAAHGFEVAEFGRHFFRIEAVPTWMEPADAEPFLRDLLGAFRDGRFPHAGKDPADDELARLAATKAVRLPPAVGEADVQALVAALFATPSPLTNPAGRTTFIELNHGELSRRFQR